MRVRVEYHGKPEAVWDVRLGLVLANHRTKERGVPVQWIHSSTYTDHPSSHFFLELQIRI